MQVTSGSRAFQPGGFAAPPSTPNPPTASGVDTGDLYESLAPATSSPNVSRFASNLVAASVQQQFAERFEALATQPEQFHAVLERAFGAQHDRGAAESLRQRALLGDTSWLPRIRFVGSETLGGAHGAYDAASQTVLLNQNARKDPELLLQIYAEEAGHHLDTLLNVEDARGDEGEAFRRLLFGEHLTQTQLNQILDQDDRGTVTLDGRTVSVEFWNPLADIAQGISSAASWVSERATHAARSVGAVWERTKNVAKDAWDCVEDQAARTWDAGKTLVSGVRNAAVGVAMNVGELVGQLGKGVGEILSGDADGWKHIGLALAKVPQSAVDAALMVGGSLVSAAQTVAHLEPRGRSLSDEEVAQLRPIFGDSIDYAAVVLKEGDSGVLTASGRAFVLGNTIYLPHRDRGNLPILAHEMTHVWQHQNGGTDYASEALTARYFSAESEHAAYDWTKAVPHVSWGQLNPEQQGAFIEAAVAHGAFEQQPPQFDRAPYGFTGTLDDLNRYLSSTMAHLRAGVGAP